MQHSLHIVKEDFCLGSELAKSCKYEKLSFSFSTNSVEVGPILLADFVMAESGTGIVHLAPDHGMEDFNVCKSESILPDCDYLNAQGDFNSSASSFLRGMNIFTGANETILEYLKCSGSFLACSYHRHRYPIDWRTKKPVIQRATQQWFVSISDLLSQLKSSLESVKFIPDTGKQKMLNMLQSRTEWCISRQRHWGLPIPAFKQGEELLLRSDWVKHFAEIVQKDGSDAWWKLPTAELVPRGVDVASLEKTFNTLDVWFDSGTVWSNFLDDCPETVYLEGSDQFRGWFQSSLITSVAVKGKSPYSKVISHGFVLDHAGHKMSKSLGNVIDPQTIVNSEGADVLRLWAASTNYSADVSIGPEILSQISENRRKLRNTLRFIVANMEGFDGRSIDWTELKTIDKLVYGKLAQVLKDCRQSYESHDFQKGNKQIDVENVSFIQFLVVNALQCFCVDDLSAFYLDTLKDRLYTEPISSSLRQATQALLKVMAKALVSALNPVTPFLCHEIALELGLADFEWPEQKDEFDCEQYQQLVTLRNDFMELFRSKLRTRFNCKSTFALDVTISSNALKLNEAELAELLQVAQVHQRSLSAEDEVDTFNLLPDIHLQVEYSDRQKCPRCWTFNAENEEIPCSKCQQQLTIPLNKQLEAL